MEIWKDIKGYEGLYQVSNLGRVKSLKRYVWNGKSYYLKNERILKFGMMNSGYKFVGLWKNNKSKNASVHQLVAMAFLGHKPCGYKLVVDHINNDKLDNRAENLQIVTNRFNSSKDKVGTSKHTGVSLQKQTHKNKNGSYRFYEYWCASIVVNRKTISLGNYKTEEQAARAYQLALKQIENGEEIRKEEIKRQVRYND